MKKTLAAAGLGISGIAFALWIGAAAGWEPRGLEISLVAVQTNIPASVRWGVSSAGKSEGLGGIGVRVQRYAPLPNPVEGPPEEYRDQSFPFTAWLVSLQHSTHTYGFSYQTDPVFDRSSGHPRFMGMFEEWTVPYWFIVLATGLGPAVAVIRRRVRSRGWPAGSSIASAGTAVAFVLFAAGSFDRGWSEEFELAASLLLAAGALVFGVVAVRRRRTWGAIGFNGAFWGMLLLVYLVHHR